MEINCLLIIKNTLLKHIIENYILKTPFLTCNKFIYSDIDLKTIDLYDIVIIEKECLSFSDFESVVGIKPTIVLSKIFNKINLEDKKNTSFFNTSLTHKDFVNHISNLIDKL